MRWTKWTLHRFEQNVRASKMWHDRWQAVSEICERHMHDEVCEEGESFSPEYCQREAESRGWA